MTTGATLRRWVFALAILLLASLQVSAQAPENLQALVIRVGVPFTVVANHDGVGVDGFRVRDNGSILVTKTKSEAWADGVVSIRLTSGLPTSGLRVITVGTYNAGGETTSANSVLMRVAP